MKFLFFCLLLSMFSTSILASEYPPILPISLSADTSSSGQQDPIKLWLESASTNRCSLALNPAGKVNGIKIYFNQEFTGEIAILSDTNRTVYQKHHGLNADGRELNLKIENLNKGQYLVLLHDFKKKELNTLKLEIK